MKKRYLFLGSALLIFYLILLSFTIRFLIHIMIQRKEIEGLLFWILMFIMNLIISVIIVKIKNEKGLIIKSFLASIISNFFIIGLTGFLMTRPFAPSLHRDIHNILFALGDSMVTIFAIGNWLLPILFVLIKKAEISCNIKSMFQKKVT